jgi:hypothetical protein
MVAGREEERRARRAGWSSEDSQWTGILLRSGIEVEADIVVTATGLNLLAFGGMRLTIDGRDELCRRPRPVAQGTDRGSGAPVHNEPADRARPCQRHRADRPDRVQHAARQERPAAAHDRAAAGTSRPRALLPRRRLHHQDRGADESFITGASGPVGIAVDAQRRQRDARCRSFQFAVIACFDLRSTPPEGPNLACGASAHVLIGDH